jgi:acyl-coenzyme A thioesterase PaaI-like protein
MADRTLTISWEDPNELAARAHGSSGIEFLRAIAAGELPRAPTATGRVLAEGNVIHAGKTVAMVEGTLRSEEGGALLAHGTSTCLIR